MSTAGSLEGAPSALPPTPLPPPPQAPRELGGAEPAVESPPPELPRGFAGSLLTDDEAWPVLAKRTAIGLGLSSVYGLALGTREGVLSMAEHAAGAPLALLAVAALGLPALYILLALFDAPLSVPRAAAAAVRGIASAGLVLAGLAPLAALYVVGSESASAAAVAGTIGLVAGGALGLRQLVITLRAALAEAGAGTRTLASFAQVGFVLFAIVLAARVWGAVLPVLGGAS